MAEYGSALVQAVPVGQNVQFTDTIIRCTKGYIQHRAGSGIFTLRGITECCFARYRIFFGGNIAVPASQTVSEISLAIAIEGEPIGTSIGTFTPAAVDEYGNVAMAAFIDVPRGCCVSIAVENISNVPVNVRNANLIIDRVA